MEDRTKYVPCGFTVTYVWGDRPNRGVDYSNTHGIVFVVDASDRDRIYEARDELQALLKSDELRDAVLLVYANKQDLPGSLTPSELTDKLGLHELYHRNWYIQGACATRGEGLNEGK